MPGNKKWNSDWVVLLLRPKGLTIKESRASLNTRNQRVSWKFEPLQIYFFQKKAEVHLKLDLLKSKHPSQMPVQTSGATFTEVQMDSPSALQVFVLSVYISDHVSFYLTRGNSENVPDMTTFCIRNTNIMSQLDGILLIKVNSYPNMRWRTHDF